MARRKEYTAAALWKGVRRYFKSISRVREVTEQVPTGRLDDKGHMIYGEKTVLNQLGKPVTVVEYLEPPTVAGLCEALGIHRSTWANYCDGESYPEFEAVTGWAREKLQAWNERELLTRAGKDIKGIVFNLENNYGYKEQTSVEVQGGGLEDFLRRQQEGDGM